MDRLSAIVDRLSAIVDRLVDDFSQLAFGPPHLILEVVEHHVEEIEALRPLDAPFMERMPSIDAREFALPFRIDQGQGSEAYVDAPEDTRHWPEDFQGLDYVGVRENYAEWSLEQEEDLEGELTVVADASTVEADEIMSAEADSEIAVEADAEIAVEADAEIAAEADTEIAAEADTEIMSLEADEITAEADTESTMEAGTEIMSVTADEITADIKAPPSLAATNPLDSMTSNSILFGGIIPGGSHIATMGVKDVGSITSLAFGPTLEPRQ